MPWELFVPNARGCGMRPFADAARKPVSTGTECGTSLNAGSHPPVSFTPGLNSALPFSSKVRAVCTSSARTDLHGGPPARVVPTVTSKAATIFRNTAESSTSCSLKGAASAAKPAHRCGRNALPGVGNTLGGGCLSPRAHLRLRRRKTVSTVKIQNRHCERLAYVYVRQSTPWQVIEHRESTERQYHLRERALAHVCHGDL